MNKIRIGVLGSGTILDAHAPALMANNEFCEVVTIATKQDDEKSIKRIHNKLGKEVEIVDDYKQILERENIDAVDIILPHHLHKPAVVTAARAGKQILVEKVMARNIYECDDMIKACKDSGVSLVVGHDRRYYPEWAALKKIVDSGKLGDILFFKLEHNQNVIFPKNSWVYKKNSLGGGAIMSCLTHQIDALRWFGGEVATVAAMSKSVPERMEGECIGTITAKMKSDALAQLSINWYTTSNRTKNGLWYELIHICGTEGEAYFMTDKGAFYKIHDESDKRIFEYELGQTKKSFEKVEVDSSKTAHETMITEWIKHLRGEDADILTFGTDSRKTVEVAEAAYRSIEEQSFINLPIKPKPWIEE